MRGYHIYCSSAVSSFITKVEMHTLVQNPEIRIDEKKLFYYRYNQLMGSTPLTTCCGYVWKKERERSIHLSCI